MNTQQTACASLSLRAAERALLLLFIILLAQGVPTPGFAAVGGGTFSLSIIEPTVYEGGVAEVTIYRNSSSGAATVACSRNKHGPDLLLRPGGHVLSHFST